MGLSMLPRASRRVVRPTAAEPGAMRSVGPAVPLITKEKTMGTEIEMSLDRLAKDFRAVITDAEGLLQATANETGDRAVAARERIIDTLADAKARLARVEEALGAKVKEVARATDNYVHEHPWQAAGIAAGVGVLIGMLISRR
jgi:ElaB/YqjD/DUF883 family membrane-anchored ribosome-binding protein